MSWNKHSGKEPRVASMRHICLVHEVKWGPRAWEEICIGSVIFDRACLEYFGLSVSYKKSIRLRFRIYHEYPSMCVRLSDAQRRCCKGDGKVETACTFCSCIPLRSLCCGMKRVETQLHCLSSLQLRDPLASLKTS